MILLIKYSYNKRRSNTFLIKIVQDINLCAGCLRTGEWNYIYAFKFEFNGFVSVDISVAGFSSKK